MRSTAAQFSHLWPPYSRQEISISTENSSAGSFLCLSILIFLTSCSLHLCFSDQSSNFLSSPGSLPKSLLMASSLPACVVCLLAFLLHETAAFTNTSLHLLFAY